MLAFFDKAKLRFCYVSVLNVRIYVKRIDVSKTRFYCPLVNRANLITNLVFKTTLIFPLWSEYIMLSAASTWKLSEFRLDTYPYSTHLLWSGSSPVRPGFDPWGRHVYLLLCGHQIGPCGFSRGTSVSAINPTNASVCSKDGWQVAITYYLRQISICTFRPVMFVYLVVCFGLKTTKLNQRLVALYYTPGTNFLFLWLAVSVSYCLFLSFRNKTGAIILRIHLLELELNTNVLGIF